MPWELKCTEGNSTAGFTPSRKVPFLLIMQCLCKGPRSALLLFFFFLQMGMSRGAGLGLQAQATCVFETVLLTFPAPSASPSLPLSLFSLLFVLFSFLHPHTYHFGLKFLVS